MFWNQLNHRLQTFNNKRFILLVITAAFCFSFQSSGTFFIKQPFSYFTTDNLGNSYLVNGEEISKYNSSGLFFKNFSNKRFGNISSVDATNALKVLLYYKDFQQILFLDNQLSQNGDAISLENLGYEQTDLVCTSFNNSFWIYNKQNNELIRFDENSQLITKTGNLKQILQSEIKPNFMLEHNGYLYLNSPAQGIYVFDIYGTFNKIISIKNLQSFQVNNTVVYFYSDTKLCAYNSKTFEEQCLQKSDSLVKSIRIEKDRRFIQYKDSLAVLVNGSK
jgi:hypothetical protein